MRNFGITDYENVTSIDDIGMSRLAQRYATAVSQRKAADLRREQETDLTPYLPQLEVARRKLARALEAESENIGGHLPVSSVYDALQIVKAQNANIGVRALTGHLETLWKADRQASLSANSFLTLRDHYTRNYPKAGMGEVFDAIAKKGYLALPMSDLVKIASEIQTQEDFDLAMMKHGLDGRQPHQVKARKFVLAVLNGETDMQAQEGKKAGRSEYLGNFGDVNWPESGGELVFRNNHGFNALIVNPWKINTGEVKDINDPDMEWLVYDIVLDPYKYENGKIVDEYGHTPWFAKDEDTLESVVSTTGTEKEEFIKFITSDDGYDLMRAYEIIGAYGGYDEFGDQHYVDIEGLRSYVSDVPELMQDLADIGPVESEEDEDLEDEDDFDKEGRKQAQSNLEGRPFNKDEKDYLYRMAWLQDNRGNYIPWNREEYSELEDGVILKGYTLGYVRNDSFGAGEEMVEDPKVGDLPKLEDVWPEWEQDEEDNGMFGVGA